jgi:CubicO group peptidase (beta-lactamase class C family)
MPPYLGPFNRDRSSGLIRIISLLFLLSCPSVYAQEEKSVAGTWVAAETRDGRTDDYLISIKKKKDRFTGYFESRMDGNLLPRIDIDQVEYRHPGFMLRMNTGNLVITYSGEISGDGNQLTGRFEYSNPEIAPKKLVFTRQWPAQPSSPDYQYKKPGGRTFPAASPGEVNLDETRMTELVRRTARGNFGEINSLLLIRDGKLVVEEYFNGFDSGQLHQLQSATKSITSLLVGIALDLNLVRSVDDKVLEYLPETRHAAGWEQVTLRHLLTMSSGVEWIREDPRSPWDKDSGIRGILEKPVTGIPGTRFEYNSAMQVLAGVLEQVSGMELEEFAEKYLFNPLDIKDYTWQASTVDSMPLCTGALALKPIDMAKIGLMVLQKGSYGGKQVVSQNWINESTRVQMEVPDNRGNHYGYLWWIGTRREEMVYAHGLGSQFIFIIPGHGLVAVTTGNNLYNGKDLKPFDMLGLIF